MLRESTLTLFPYTTLFRSQGDERAFAALIARYQPAIRGFAAIWAPSRDEADDIAQEVFIQALQGYKNFDANRDLKTWLRSEDHTSELQSPVQIVCRLLLET